MKPLGYILSSLAILFSILWFYFEPGFEPLVTSLAGLAGLFFTIRSKRHTSVKVKNGRKSTGPIESTVKSDISGSQNLSSPQLPEKALNILHSLSELKDMENVSSTEVAGRFNIKHQEAKFYLDILHREGLTTGPYYIDEGQQYCLSEKGRIFLFKNLTVKDGKKEIDNEIEISILVKIGIEKDQTHTIYSLIEEFDVPLIKIEYYLDKLTSEGFLKVYAKQSIVLRSGDVLAKCYKITAKGKAFLIENKII